MTEKRLPPLTPLSPQEWENLIDDFHYGGPRRHRWVSLYSISSIPDLVLSSILKKDFPLTLKLQLFLFLEEFSDFFFTQEPPQSLDRLIDTLRAVIQVPIDGINITFALKEQFMVSTTSILISTEAFDNIHQRHIGSLVELLLAVINRPNFGLDRQTRAIACECLRELEKSYPCLLSDIAGHLWSLCQNERTHASQNYILLFTCVIYNIMDQNLNVSILNTSVPLVPFNVPQSLLGSGSNTSKDLSGLNYKELRRAMAFLLEWPQVMTPCGMVEFLAMVMPVAEALELQPSMLKVQFFGMIYSYDPLLCHVVLMMYLHFLDAFDGQEGELSRRLFLISREGQHYLVFRLLSLHWFLGFNELISKKDVDKAKSIVELRSSFYPTVFDPLALKALKLDLLTFCSVCLDKLRVKFNSGEDVGTIEVALKLFEDGLISVSAFKWLPPGSTETAVAFRTFHKFLIGPSSHSDNDPSTTRLLMDSIIFHTVQEMLVGMILDCRRLVPVIVAFVDRLLNCEKHNWLGEQLLQKFDERLLPKGSRVLGICRTMLMHHHSSRLFLRLSHLLAFTCLYFPDLEIRDNARIYLRMLICVPGKKLRDLLNLGELFLGISPSQHSSSFFSVQSPRSSQKFKTARNLSSFVHIEREAPLLVKQSWSLSLSNLGVSSSKPANLEGVRDSENPVEEVELFDNSNAQFITEAERIDQVQEPLRVMDSKVSEILSTLRKHFSCIPDFRHMPGFKVRISCNLRFESKPFNQMLGIDSPAGPLDGIDALPAIYATVLNFSSSAPYGPIPPYRIPFLLGEPPMDDNESCQDALLGLVPVENGSREEENSRAPVVIEMEPREPTPGLVNIQIETNAENGQIVQGPLHGITVGIEDMFLKPIVPFGIPEDSIPGYNLDLFSALWEACGSSSNTGRETFTLKGGKGVTAISGTQSVKLLEVPAPSLIQATERYLAPFVASVIGDPLVDIVREGGVIRDIIWKNASDASDDATSVTAPLDMGPLHLTYNDDENEGEGLSNIRKRNMGLFLILIFLPPRFHLLFQMEVCDVSTLVRIRTDHWPSLAYIDDYLEALYLV
ncbi:AP-5 complex subunit beta-1 [Quillaja saponaria]|uniref:AP-5 complex subunit beta-1 n=1 Tax=Quillaja saponaria TaxID=32244 RepID=A0AAD7KNG2_QUISA|nr:AP-5 complex subunit beta-1 [Quillaja saponaria]